MKKLLFVAVGFLVVLIALILAPATSYGLDQYQCLACHNRPGLSKTNGNGMEVSLYVDERDFSGSAHRYIDCTTCHTQDPHNVPTPLTKLSLAEKCGTCHQYQYQQHLQSIHGEQLARGNPDVATCVDCHSPVGNPHSVVRVLQPNAPAYPKNIAQTCGKCHADPDLMGRYGIVEKVYESYMRSFHGKATQLASDELSQLDKATCVNCHGTHNIKLVADPNSPVAGMENLVRTCEQCHSGAGINMASGFLGHKEATPERFPVVHWAERFFYVLTASVVSLGVIMVAMESGRWLAGRRRRSRHNNEEGNNGS
ncbi:MAG: hypothetical protein HY669_04595 [Chloroflexi bacterium]|nr:hypothetical protein [Chloroflexota bacterium]